MNQWLQGFLFYKEVKWRASTGGRQRTKHNFLLNIVFLLYLTALLSPSMPFAPQALQGPVNFAQPRPPLMNYGCVISDDALYFSVSFISSILDVNRLLSPQLDLRTPPTSLEEAEATTTTSVARRATWGSHATSGETVRVTFIPLRSRCNSQWWRKARFDLLNISVLSCTPTPGVGFFLLTFLPPKNVQGRPTPRDWISWPGRSRWHGFLLEAWSFMLTFFFFFQHSLCSAPLPDFLFSFLMWFVRFCCNLLLNSFSK